VTLSSANLEHVDLTVPIIVVAGCSADLLLALGRGVFNAGGRISAATPLRRTVTAVLRLTGRLTIVAAAVVFVGGTWIGVRTKSAWQNQRDAAAHACDTEYPRFVEWEQAGNSLDNWWTGDPLPHGPVPGRSSRRQFIDRCVLVNE
jgi:hypothetical protein